MQEIRLAELAQDLLVGLATMHNSDPTMFHRSLHPGNVLLRKTGDGRLQFALADWQLGVPLAVMSAGSVWLPPECEQVPAALNWLNDDHKDGRLDAAFDNGYTVKLQSCKSSGAHSCWLQVPRRFADVCHVGHQQTG